MCLLLGASGSGKTLLMKMLQKMSSREGPADLGEPPPTLPTAQILTARPGTRRHRQQLPGKKARGREEGNTPSTSRGSAKTRLPQKGKAPHDATSLVQLRATAPATVPTTSVSPAQEPVADGALSAANSSVVEAAATAPQTDEDVQSKGQVGTNLTDLVMQRRKLTVRELGGCMGPIWPSYYADCSSLLFVIDAANPTQVAASCVQLLSVLSAETLQAAPVLILFNKTDLPCYMSIVEMKSLFRMNSIISCAKQPITVLEICARDGTGLPAVLQWLQSTCKG
ncbi:ADP-ribosylation factor-like protein 16 [Ambystoma mexicanum]|uniref:ADP-ribosylation factor-like protein 16 n=1 Tax=Ambystoma mexicanum TaxID=8296 RepID=UPI0037E9440E